MAEALSLLLSMVLGTGGTIAIVAWDERRLSPAALARAWPLSTRLAAALAFGPLCLPVHFVRTRRSWLGVVLGVASAALVVGVLMLIELALHAALD